MKNSILIILTLFIASSCTLSKKDRLMGTWGSVSVEKNAGSKDSVKVHYFIEFTDHGIYYLN